MHRRDAGNECQGPGNRERPSVRKDQSAGRLTVTLLEISGLTKRFGSLLALDNVSLTVAEGEVHCLLGENGAGKSTLCNLVYGVYRPDSGSIALRGRPLSPKSPADALRQGIAMVHQHFSLVPTMTVIENLMLGRARPILEYSEMISRMEALDREYGFVVDPHSVVEEMSVGERQRVEIIKCLLGDPKLLVLDEPTAVLKPEETAALLSICRRLTETGKSVVLVTHKLAEIAKVADRTTVLRHGRLVETVEMAGADMRALVRSMVGRDVSSADAVLAATIGIGDAAEPETAATARPKTPVQKTAGFGDGTAALELVQLALRGRDGVSKLDDVSLTVRRCEIVGVAGVEGNGQNELGNILAGLTTPSSGTVKVDGRDVTRATPQEITASGVGIVPEDRHAVAIASELSVAENLLLGRLDRFSRFGILNRRAMREAAAGLMRKFDVRCESPDLPMSSLSGGNQQKAVLARELSLDHLTFLLAAQPTRGLDVGAVEAVYSHIRAARDQGLGVLLISSELDELIAVSDRVVVLYRGRIVGEMPGNPANREAIGAMMSGHVPEPVHV
ncbi:MAG: ABC transporter ATP-binding protein [Hyphomicrobiales bacterium]|nr:ABC transporter ATP-binding protein [Hyphomicrobiales bacterium]